MARHSSIGSLGGPKTPQRGKVLFHLVHEHGYWVLDAREENASNVHSKALAPHASCSVLYSTRFGSLDVGLKIRHPLFLVKAPSGHRKTLLALVLTAQASDFSLVSALSPTHVEEHALKIQRGYARLLEWLIFHPGITVPEDIFNRISH